jgi:hypothetical protein
MLTLGRRTGSCERSPLTGQRVWSDTRFDRICANTAPIAGPVHHSIRIATEFPHCGKCTRFGGRFRAKRRQRQYPRSGRRQGF